MAESETSDPSPRYRSWCLIIRLKCLIVAYLHLFAVIVDIICHVVVVAIVTDGFQCDANERSLHRIDWRKLESILLAINIGTHGFFPLPLTIDGRTLSSQINSNSFSPETTCYPGMFHVYMSDILNFLINILWLYLVRLFVKAVHKKDYEPIRLFFMIGVLKLIIQLLTGDFSYQPTMRSLHSNSLGLIKLLDMAISGLCLTIIYEYMKVIKEERKQEAATRTRVNDQPPSYAECLIASPPDGSKKEVGPVVENQPEAGEIRPILDSNPDIRPVNSSTATTSSLDSNLATTSSVDSNTGTIPSVISNSGISDRTSRNEAKDMFTV